MCLQASWYPRVSQRAPSTTYPNSSVLRGNKWPNLIKNGDHPWQWYSHVQTETLSVLFQPSATGRQRTDRQLAYSLELTLFIYLASVFLRSSLVSSPRDGKFLETCYAFTGNTPNQQFNSFPVLSLSLMWQRSVWCQKWKLYCSYNAIKTLHRRQMPLWPRR